MLSLPSLLAVSTVPLLPRACDAKTDPAKGYPSAVQGSGHCGFVSREYCYGVQGLACTSLRMCYLSFILFDS